MSSTPGSLSVGNELHQRLCDFIESAYPIRDESLIRERRRLLDETGTIWQEPSIEITPAYAHGPRLAEIGLPDSAASFLQSFSGDQHGLGIYDPPYAHQAQALHAILSEKADVLVTTGTGSGKTEVFLHSILASLATEAQERPEQFARPGMRALILYPMNALVSDQLTRIRRLFGDERMIDAFLRFSGRPARFGMYTSRTPYPGATSSERDRNDVAPIIRHFLKLERSATGDRALADELARLGRRPAKDLSAFLDGDRPFQTGSRDAEMLTRQEMQTNCPDILVTNYSMLEYMMIRPIERSIFEQTRQRLQENPNDDFYLVLDEAHMYRGVAGAEVAYLIRRLITRLGISRDRLRCILTSASVDSSERASRDALRFARDLVGLPESRPETRLVRGELLKRGTARPGTVEEAEALARIAASSIHQIETDEIGTFSELAKTLSTIDLPLSNRPVASRQQMQQDLYRLLDDWGPVCQLRESATGGALALRDLPACIFPDALPEIGVAAVETLLNLCAFAHDSQRALLPTRLHLFFRGLPSLYACINPRCPHRREQPGDELTLGRMYAEPRLQCECGARTYELASHRDCGAVFLRVYVNNEGDDFYWHERGKSRTPLDLLIDQPIPGKNDAVERVYIEMRTGQVRRQISPEQVDDFLPVFRPVERIRKGSREAQRAHRESARFTPGSSPVVNGRHPDCPACGKRKSGPKIRDLAVQGERPFATLVREQLIRQQIHKPISQRHPNGGRKTLLFSDGRQRAARLARDLPREVERDGFRQATFTAAKRLHDLNIEPVLDRRLYAAFISVCAQFHLPFFDREQQSAKFYQEHLHAFRNEFDCNLQEAIEAEWDPTVPRQYATALLRVLADPYYAIYDLQVGAVVPSKSALSSLNRRGKIEAILPKAGNDLEAITVSWINDLLDTGAFDATIDQFERWAAIPTPKLKPSYALAKETASLIGLSADETDLLGGRLLEHFTTPLSTEDARALDPKKLALRIAIDDSWWQCGNCHQLHLLPIARRCPGCGSSELVAQGPSSEYVRSRAEYFRAPLRAAMNGVEPPVTLSVEEHTAQLNHRDRAAVWATTEEFELRFQDLCINDDLPPVDVLSCTTTMEVGIDIGALNAVGLGNVPPQRENYQQRAGRAGRRSSAVSTVMTYARDNAHDAHYFQHPSEIIAGPPRTPKIDVANQNIAKRHLNALLIQTFFHEQIDAGVASSLSSAARNSLMSTLGDARDFFSEQSEFGFNQFRTWIGELFEDPDTLASPWLSAWLPEQLLHEGLHRSPNAFLRDAAMEFLHKLAELADRDSSNRRRIHDTGNGAVTLLDLLFDAALLPSYAFPTDLCSFIVFGRNNTRRITIEEKMEQDRVRALGEYAPGRQLVVNKKTYQINGLVLDAFGKQDQELKRLFADPLPRIIQCQSCTYVQLDRTKLENELCPVCGSALLEQDVIDPPAFTGSEVREDRTQASFSMSSIVQLPIPLEQTTLSWRKMGPHLDVAAARLQPLIVTNMGPDDTGFRLCERCGAVLPSNHPEIDREHRMPVPGVQSGPMCSGSFREESIIFGHTFLTDLILLRAKIDVPLDADPTSKPLRNGLRSLAEALSHAAALELDIDPQELQAGYRFIPDSGSAAIIDFFIYDAASGGAGYALEVSDALDRILDRAVVLLEYCPAGCDSSCTRCLRHYGNRFWHDELDRFLARELLRYLRTGKAPMILPDHVQRQKFVPLERFLQLEGDEATFQNDPLTHHVLLHVAWKQRNARSTILLKPDLYADVDFMRDHAPKHGTFTIVSPFELAADLPECVTRIRTASP